MHRYWFDVEEHLEQKKLKDIEKWVCFFWFKDHNINKDLINIKPQKLNFKYGVTSTYIQKSIFTAYNILREEQWKYICIFDEEQECIDFYNKRVYLEIETMQKLSEKCNNFLENTNKEFINTDYIMEKLKGNNV